MHRALILCLLLLAGFQSAHAYDYPFKDRTRHGSWHPAQGSSFRSARSVRSGSRI
jgi:hypothetical protein